MGPGIARRTLLTGTAASVIALSACVSQTPAPPTGTPVAPEPATFADLVAEKPFYIAHRGGWRNWPEMTAFSYQQAVALPLVKAIEISVVLTADGVLVCSHDLTTTRLTGAPYAIARVPWATLEPLLVTSAYTDDPSQPYRPLSKLDDVIDHHIQSHVVFIEPKSADAVEPLKRKLVELNQPTRTVWKQPINQANFAWAKGRGYSTWGYALDEPSHTGSRLRTLVADSRIDMFGIEFKRDSAAVSELVDLAAAVGKTTVMTNVETPDQRRRALGLGCRGLMTADIRNLPGIPI